MVLMFATFVVHTFAFEIYKKCECMKEVTHYDVYEEIGLFIRRMCIESYTSSHFQISVYPLSAIIMMIHLLYIKLMS
jgi:membrane protein CcdC involved in cytochrome C biogenesis